jgi:hypothetical protein
MHPSTKNILDPGHDLMSHIYIQFSSSRIKEKRNQKENRKPCPSWQLSTKYGMIDKVVKLVNESVLGETLANDEIVLVVEEMVIEDEEPDDANHASVRGVSLDLRPTTTFSRGDTTLTLKKSIQ